MKILVACEESQAVCKAFREKGHEAYSCDIQECSGGHPEWHIKGDVLKIINGNCTFTTQDNKNQELKGKWDIIIAHPPCTHLAVSGARHFEQKRKDGRQYEAIDFFTKILEANCDKICIENPVGIISGNYIVKHYPEFCSQHNLPQKPAQIIQPYQFGHPFTKTTCLWLKGLPKLIPTNIVDYKKGVINSSYAYMNMYDENGKTIAWNDPRTAKLRSKTFEGIARAMADQWG